MNSLYLEGLWGVIKFYVPCVWMCKKVYERVRFSHSILWNGCILLTSYFVCRQHSDQRTCCMCRLLVYMYDYNCFWVNGLANLSCKETELCTSFGDLKFVLFCWQGEWEKKGIHIEAIFWLRYFLFLRMNIEQWILYNLKERSRSINEGKILSILALLFFRICL